MVVAWGIGLFALLAGLGVLVTFLAPPDSGFEELLGWVLVLPTVGLLVAGPILRWRWLVKRGIGGIARRDSRE